MNTDIDLGKFEQEVRRLEESFAAARAAAERTHRTSLLVGVILATILVGFLLVNYFNFRRELTTEKLAASIHQELKEVSPVAFRELGQLGQGLLPVYAHEWRTQFAAAWPAIKEKVDREISLLAENVVARVDRRLIEAEQRVLDQSQNLFVTHFPQLKDPKSQAATAARIHEICDVSLRKALDDFNSVFARDMMRIQRAILDFELPEINASTPDLQKKFLHLWLQLLDEEVMQL